MIFGRGGGGCGGLAKLKQSDSRQDLNRKKQAKCNARIDRRKIRAALVLFSFSIWQAHGGFGRMRFCGDRRDGGVCVADLVEEGYLQ